MDDELGPLVDLGRERPQIPARARNMSPIVPRASISGRALVAVVAIMTFLASITTGAVMLVSASASEWQSDVASEITVQVRPVAGRDMEVAYTPGHASHHVSYFDDATGIAWVGDTGGVCVEGGYILPPTPPPDIDLPAWQDSLQRIEAWHPQTLFLTHCGPVSQVHLHVRTLAENLGRMADWVRDGLAEEADDASRKAEFERRLRRELRRHMSEDRAEASETAAAFGLLWQGLARYWRRRASS